MANILILNDLLKELNISLHDLERRSGLSNGTLRKAIEKKSELSLKNIEKIRTAYPDVSMQWLLTGKGDMFMTSDTEEGAPMPYLSTKRREVLPLGKHIPLRLKPEEYAAAFGDWAGLPMYNAPITASFVETYRDENTYQPQYYLHDPRFKDCNFGAIITGDSMHSEIRHGDFVVCKEVEDQRFVVFGDIYYVVASNGLETCKYLNTDPNSPDNYLLIPKNERISPSPIPKDMVRKLFKVRGIVRGY